jgi:1,4-dihydroxy-6-naphthoate synthase
MKLSLGFSPCPNDTFIFDALVNKKIDTGDIEFNVILEDVESLNRMALQDKLDISKISYGVLPRIIPAYRVLDAGGALGQGVGPILISASPIDIDTVPDLSIALPGFHTTAHMLFNLAFPQAVKKVYMKFSDIEDAVLTGETNLGVIIHENRFTYQQKGLHKVMDLGEYWEQNTQCPIPLGGIVMNRQFDIELMNTINSLIRESIEYSRKTYPVLSDFVKQHSQEMEEEVMRKHIDLYVNEYSLSLGSKGRAAVWQLLDVASHFIPPPVAGSYEVFI